MNEIKLHENFIQLIRVSCEMQKSNKKATGDFFSFLYKYKR